MFFDFDSTQLVSCPEATQPVGAAVLVAQHQEHLVVWVASLLRFLPAVILEPFEQGSVLWSTDPFYSGWQRYDCPDMAEYLKKAREQNLWTDSKILHSAADAALFDQTVWLVHSDKNDPV